MLVGKAKGPGKRSNAPSLSLLNLIDQVRSKANAPSLQNPPKRIFTGAEHSHSSSLDQPFLRHLVRCHSSQRLKQLESIGYGDRHTRAKRGRRDSLLWLCTGLNLNFAGCRLGLGFRRTAVGATSPSTGTLSLGIASSLHFWDLSCPDGQAVLRGEPRSVENCLQASFASLRGLWLLTLALGLSPFPPFPFRLPSPKYSWANDTARCWDG